jgi:hypothetical protein
MSASTPVPRPASVTIVVVLTWLAAIGSLISGALALLPWNAKANAFFLAD